MTLVRIEKNWTWPDLLGQTPGRSGVWEDITFTLEPVGHADYLVVLNQPAMTIEMTCPPDHVWAILQEPRNAWTQHWHEATAAYSRLYTTDTDLHGPCYLASQPALPWHVGKDYDFLRACSPSEKTKALSWITSNQTVLPGQQARMRFLAQVQPHLALDLYGRGFQPIDSKWDGLAPYRYALAIENSRNAYYWTEKIADCFLSWTMPIYYGCSRITEFFPAEAMICIDLDAPDVVKQVQAAVASDAWLRHRDAIAYARELVLTRYQLFPFLTSQIRQFESAHGPGRPPQPIRVTPVAPPAPSLRQRIGRRWRSFWRSLQ